MNAIRRRCNARHYPLTASAAIRDISSKDGSARRNVDVEHLGDHLRPAVKKIRPAILRLQVTLQLLTPGLIKEDEIAPIIKVPGYALLRKKARIGYR